MQSTSLKTFTFSLLAAGISTALAAETTNVKTSTQAETSVGKDLYSPLGIRLGSFLLSPTLDSRNEWNDNIYSTQENLKDDFIFHIQPGLNVASQWSRHALNFSAGSDVLFYATHSGEDQQNYFFNLDGRFDVMRDSFATAKFYYRHQFENRGSPEPIANISVNPLENDTIGGKIGYEHKINRLRINVSNDTQQLNYLNGVDPFGTVIYNDERNRLVNTSEMRLGYELFSGYEAYLKGSYNFINYDNLFVNQGNLDRSSDGYRVEGGLTVDLTHTLAADAHVGYQGQNYDSPSLESIDGVTGGLDLTWRATKLTTVKTGVNRTIQETTIPFESGYFSTVVASTIEHELLRNLIIGATGGYTNNDFQGTAVPNRDEDYFNGGLNLKYMLNRNFYLKTGYDYRGRTTNLSNSDYDINVVYFTIGSQL